MLPETSALSGSKPHERHGGERLAAARFANQAQGFAAFQRKLTPRTPSAGPRWVCRHHAQVGKLQARQSAGFIGCGTSCVSTVHETGGAYCAAAAPGPPTRAGGATACVRWLRPSHSAQRVREGKARSDSGESSFSRQAGVKQITQAITQQVQPSTASAIAAGPHRSTGGLEHERLQPPPAPRGALARC